MAVLAFENFTFEEFPDNVRFWFLKHFYFDIPKSDIESISDFNISDDKEHIEFFDISEKSAENKLFRFIEFGLNNLYNSINNSNNKTIYVHRDSGIPLIGSRIFGIVDRGSNMLEVKPMTSCNINCIFCSVDEGISSKKVVDFVVEKDYLVSEIISLIEFKRENDFDEEFVNEKIDIYINPHGEPLLYPDIVGLVKDLRAYEFVGEIHIITNGTLLTNNLVDSLVESGLTHLNVSISSLDSKNSKILAGSGAYNVEEVMASVDYASKKLSVVITPVYLPTFNEDDLKAIVLFSKKIGVPVMIQNFLENKRGRCPTKQKPWDYFYSYLDDLEKKTGVNLRMTNDDIKFFKTPQLPYPFKKNEVVKAEIICPGRYKNESIAVANNRCIEIVGHPFFRHERKKVKIIKIKNNLFKGSVS